MIDSRTSIDEINYKNGQKNNWRRTLWNSIKERLSVPAKDAVVLYLAGAADLDRKIAIEKGFRSENLIAIDRSEAKVRRLRSSGAIAIQGDFFDVLFSWRRRVAVVYGDFCSGLESRTLDQMNLLAILPQVRGSVLAFNFMRGRDPSTNELRALLNEGREAPIKNRASIASAVLLSVCCDALQDLVEVRNGRFQNCQLSEHELAERQKLRDQSGMVEGLFDCARPQQLSYKSTSGQVFDSVVMSHPLKRIDCSSWKERDDMLLAICGSETTRRKVAAALALRTMRVPQ